MQKTLSDYRKEAGYETQEALAADLGVKRNMVTRWESGTRHPKLSMISKLANKLKLSEGEIIAIIVAANKTTS